MTHTLTEVRDIAARLLADKGVDYVYPMGDNPNRACLYYTKDGQPSCFVGHVIDIWQEGVDAAHEADRSILAGSIAYSAEQVLRRAEVDAERTAVDYLTHVQEWQDSGKPWGESVLYAEHRIDLHTQYVSGCPMCDGED
jgi:hypothetical protein